MGIILLKLNLLQNIIQILADILQQQPNHFYSVLLKKNVFIACNAIQGNVRKLFFAIKQNRNFPFLIPQVHLKIWISSIRDWQSFIDPKSSHATLNRIKSLFQESYNFAFRFDPYICIIA